MPKRRANLAVFGREVASSENDIKIYSQLDPQDVSDRRHKGGGVNKEKEAIRASPDNQALPEALETRVPPH